MQRQAESDETAVPEPEVKEQPPKTASNSHKSEEGIKTFEDSENSVPTNLVAGGPIPRPPALDNIKPVYPAEQMKRIRGYDSRRGRGRGRGGRGRGRKGGALNEEESPDEVEEIEEENEKPAPKPKRRSSKRKAEEKEGKMKAKEPSRKASTSKAKAEKKSEPKEKVKESEKTKRGTTRQKKEIGKQKDDQKEGLGLGDEKASCSASIPEEGKALEGTGDAEPVEKKRRKNGKNTDKSTTEGKADQVDGRKKKRSAGDLHRKATVDYSKKKSPSKSKSSKKPGAVTGSKKKADAQLTPEQLENKKKLSRKSAAYHRARKAALLEGKSEAEAKQEGKQAWGSLFIPRLKCDQFQVVCFFSCGVGFLSFLPRPT